MKQNRHIFVKNRGWILPGIDPLCGRLSKHVKITHPPLQASVPFLHMEHLMKRTTALLLASTLMLCACGANKTDRALGGAAIGAATGAVVGSMVGAPGEGALIGASVGAASGALTEIDQINLGKPWWK